MIAGAAVDTSTMLVLAAIALAEGLARVPAGSVVLRRFLGGAWQIHEAAGPGNRLGLVHWWPPWTDTLVVPPRSHGTARLSQTDLAARMTAIASARRAARVVGAATLTLLVVGVPVGLGLAGVVGGMLAFGGVLLGQVVLLILGWRGLASLHATRREQVRFLTAHLNPFAAPALPSRLLAAATAGATPATAARALLPADRWVSWFRPRAYDAAVAQNLAHELGLELDAADDAIVQVLAQRPTIASDVFWCPRCGATYQAGARICADCNISLLPASQTVAPIARPQSTPGPG